jgi:perilipin-2
METIDKFSSIPLIESGLNTGLRVYNRVKRTNRLVCWGLETSENAALSMFESIRPAVRFIEGPLETIDKLGLKVLDCVEEQMPNLYLPPQMIYWNTKEYVSDHVVKPVLKRADSFGDIVDGAIEKADHALDKYLPDKKGQENGVDQESSEELKERNHAFLTYRRSKRLSKKFKHKISIRTANEINALKNDVHILIYAAELIATNPKEAYKKANELWAYFSKNEPENQKRPETMEELFVLLVRESARKMVHLVNFTTKHAARIPKKMKSYAREFLHHVLYLTDYLLKVSWVAIMGLVRLEVQEL